MPDDVYQPVARPPRSLAEKLGIGDGTRVRVLGVDDPALPALLAAASAEPLPEHDTVPADVVLVSAESTNDLVMLARLRDTIHPDGAIWVVSRKGRAATLRDVDVIAAARDAGLVDNKVVAFSSTHTALRLVIPRSERGRSKAPR